LRLGGLSQGATSQEDASEEQDKFSGHGRILNDEHKKLKKFFTTESQRHREKLRKEKYSTIFFATLCLCGEKPLP
jgi:hypothetical protein